MPQFIGTGKDKGNTSRAFSFDLDFLGKRFRFLDLKVIDRTQLILDILRETQRVGMKITSRACSIKIPEDSPS